MIQNKKVTLFRGSYSDELSELVLEKANIELIKNGHKLNEWMYINLFKE